MERAPGASSESDTDRQCPRLICRGCSLMNLKSGRSRSLEAARKRAKYRRHSHTSCSARAALTAVLHRCGGIECGSAMVPVPTRTRADLELLGTSTAPRPRRCSQNSEPNSHSRHGQRMNALCRWRLPCAGCTTYKCKMSRVRIRRKYGCARVS